MNVIFDFIQRKETKFTMEQPYTFPIIYCQYHICRYLGDLRSQGIITNVNIADSLVFLPSFRSPVSYSVVSCIWHITQGQVALLADHWMNKSWISNFIPRLSGHVIINFDPWLIYGILTTFHNEHT